MNPGISVRQPRWGILGLLFAISAVTYMDRVNISVTARQMMPAYHYMQFYHWAYGINQWLANQGYVVLSINYRSGVGSGRSFRLSEGTGIA